MSDMRRRITSGQGETSFARESPLSPMDADDAAARAVGLFMRRISGGFDVKEAYLFGSRARGEASDDSDIDVAVVLGGLGNLSETVARFSGVAYGVFMETGVLIDAQPLWEDEWRNPGLSTNPLFVENIKRDGVRL